MRIIVEAHHYGVSNLYELAEYVQLSEEHVLEILEHYKQKHGIGTHYGDYSITFEPLRVLDYMRCIEFIYFKETMDDNFKLQNKIK